MKKILSILAGILAILGGGGYLLATSADAATPADPLYPVDTFFENVQRTITFDDVAAVELEQKILEERQAEVEEVLGLEDISEEVVSDCLDEMEQQREKAYNKLGEAQEKQSENGNTEAVQALEKAQNQYVKSVQKQYETATKAQEKYGVGEETQKNIDNALKNMGSSTSNQQQNEEVETPETTPSNGSNENTTGGNSNAPTDRGNN